MEFWIYLLLIVHTKNYLLVKKIHQIAVIAYVGLHVKSLLQIIQISLDYQYARTVNGNGITYNHLHSDNYEHK